MRVVGHFESEWSAANLRQGRKTSFGSGEIFSTEFHASTGTQRRRFVTSICTLRSGASELPIPICATERSLSWASHCSLVIGMELDRHSALVGLAETFL